MCRTLPLASGGVGRLSAAIEDASDSILGGAGAVVDEVALPAAFAALTDARRAINDYERARAMAHEWRTDRERLSPAMRKTVASGLAVPYADYRAALALTEDCRDLLDGLFGDRDALLAPAVNGEAPLGLDYAGDPAFQSLWTMLHVPAIALPTHRGPNGMPVGIQLIARLGADDLLLSVAAWIWARWGA